MAAALSSSFRPQLLPLLRSSVNNTVTAAAHTTSNRFISTAAAVGFHRTTTNTNTTGTHLIPRSKRVMSSDAVATPGRKYEWLVIVPDFKDALSKRIAARNGHLGDLKPAVESGLYKMGGAILEEVPADDDPSSLKMCGSSLIIVAESKEEILATLRNDVYAKSGVWDVDNAQMWPMISAFRIPVVKK
ncbi:hypothetical protein B0H63DRAFT_477783 [Podospora didyma]|uniref:YCII-related domain-containing protein n=1 Tax=Podospora didyma TaxID=330526 RepID=A0AAE0NBY5_9PEZI|nr:hypothetical protein B0H63DRAFT_477783 [Podospora didyma]